MTLRTGKRRYRRLFETTRTACIDRSKRQRSRRSRICSAANSPPAGPRVHRHASPSRPVKHTALSWRCFAFRADSLIGLPHKTVRRPGHGSTLGRFSHKPGGTQERSVLCRGCPTNCTRKRLPLSTFPITPGADARLRPAPFLGHLHDRKTAPRSRLPAQNRSKTGSSAVRSNSIRGRAVSLHSAWPDNKIHFDEIMIRRSFQHHQRSRAE